MSDIAVDPRDAFEKVFPPPKHIIRCGNGYACTEYNAWGAHNFIRQWEGWSAAMLQSFGNSEQPNSPVIPDGWVKGRFTYDTLFNAIGKAVNIQGEALSISVKAFEDAMLSAAQQQE